MKLKAMFAIAAILLAGCGSDGGVNGDTSTNDGGTTTDTPTGPSGDGASTPTNDSGVGTGTDQDSGSTTDQDSGATGDQDSGSGGGDQDGGVTTDSGSGGDQDGGVTTGDSGSGGDQDSGSGDQDGGTNGGGSDSGSGGGDDGGDSCQPHSCVYTQGYYKTHTSSVTGLTLGGVRYSASEVLGFLNATPNGDDSLILAKQLIAALLNGGACDPNASATVAAAQRWMAANKDQDGTLPYGTCCVNQGEPGCTAYSLGQTLDSYNSGYAGTPHCQ